MVFYEKSWRRNKNTENFVLLNEEKKLRSVFLLFSFGILLGLFIGVYAGHVIWTGNSRFHFA